MGVPSKGVWASEARARCARRGRCCGCGGPAIAGAAAGGLAGLVFRQLAASRLARLRGRCREDAAEEGPRRSLGVVAMRAGAVKPAMVGAAASPAMPVSVAALDHDVLDGDEESGSSSSGAQGQRQLVGNRPKVRYFFQVPQAVGPEIALVGRSNAGKSTLLNTILTSRQVEANAPVSSKGGRTRTLNWYPLGFHGPVGWEKDGECTCLSDQDRLALVAAEPVCPGSGFCLVDCFGLGPVEYSLTSRRLQSWGPLLYSFLSQRRSLCAVFHLVSSEYQGALSEGDLQLISIFQRSLRTRNAQGLAPFRSVALLTKTDLHAPKEVPRIAKRLRKELGKRGQPTEGLVTCSSLASDIGNFATAMDSAAASSWASRGAWLEEAAGQPFQRRRPQVRSADERHATKEAFIRGRQGPRGRAPRGGPGAVTELPPGV